MSVKHRETEQKYIPTEQKPLNQNLFALFRVLFACFASKKAVESVSPLLIFNAKYRENNAKEEEKYLAGEQLIGNKDYV